ncbi:DUF2242 domain-containing protein [Thauera linaloolentis]|uniref:Lipoprotein n=1 Tax=Thauera linaloolentis (strain DSM 12138 / JCM 21573 / CCUG 41526 / CIP 105981 / IAM 15112 / NBRC 102519 / 47Lol) TaxID=1123367 RepID=N6XUN6_THAL4|nr:DUF2242 domain-containing protein [Thauera linaloolentis]ENO85436.1 hypothetical protein C666_15345 [Thauera linaloolentis 47Lol = DSM 12138]MCM8567651.1 DUF2242 domain-containing protein [Thauera linaloolentis]
MPRAARRLLFAALSGLLAAGCATPPPAVYQSESFQRETPFVTWSTREPADACELGKRALLSQGYRLDGSDTVRVRGEKLFQPRPDEGVTLNITLVCLPSNVGAVIYANALQTRYALKSASTSTGVSVAGIGSISLPWSADKEALVKIGEETVTDPGFYRRLFALVEVLDGTRVDSVDLYSGGVER